MKLNIFRLWYYLRQGYATYLALVIGVSNLLITSYYLAIKDVPILQFIFPSFFVFSFVIILIGIPLSASLGYFHYKKSQAQKSQIEIELESNPLTSFSLMTIILLQKIYHKEDLSDEDLIILDKLNKTAERMLHKQKRIDGL